MDNIMVIAISMYGNGKVCDWYKTREAETSGVEDENQLSTETLIVRKYAHRCGIDSKLIQRVCRGCQEEKGDGT